MTELLEPSPSDRVLEIGTGSGYQAAVLSKLVNHVFSIELEPQLAREAAQRLASLGFRNVTTMQGDGYRGWPGEAPFDKVILTAAPPQVPQALIDQLKPGGILVAPEGGRYQQQLVVIKRDHRGRTIRRVVAPVMFVPMRPAPRASTFGNHGCAGCREVNTGLYSEPSWSREAGLATVDVSPNASPVYF